jgi:hypothetical protein
VEQLWRRPSGALVRAPRGATRSTSRAPSINDALIELQAAAGNRAVTAALGHGTVQRQPGPRRGNDGGLLTLDALPAIPLRSATWSLKGGATMNFVGGMRRPELEPTKEDIGDLVVTRAPDTRSTDVDGLLGTSYESGTLRLDRPSRDGALPATSLDLRDIDVVEHSWSRGNPKETLRLGVGGLGVSGMGKEASAESAAARLLIGEGREMWPPVPVISWNRAEALRARPRITPGREPVPSLPPKLIVKIAAGPSVARLAGALEDRRRLDITLAPKGDAKVVLLTRALITGVSSTPDSPNIVEVTISSEGMTEKAPRR